jgi:hypothetical protein
MLVGILISKILYIHVFLERSEILFVPRIYPISSIGFMSVCLVCALFRNTMWNSL